MIEEDQTRKTPRKIVRAGEIQNKGDSKEDRQGRRDPKQRRFQGRSSGQERSKTKEIPRKIVRAGEIQNKGDSKEDCQERRGAAAAESGPEVND